MEGEMGEGGEYRKIIWSSHKLVKLAYLRVGNIQSSYKSKSSKTHKLITLTYVFLANKH